MSESAVVNACIRWLWLHGCYVWRNNSGMIKASYKGKERPVRFGKVGSPDIIGMTPCGRFIGVECKYGKNDLTVQQEVFRSDVYDHNGIYILARSVDDLEAHKTEILAKIYPPAYAKGAVPDHRIRPTSGNHGAVV